MFIVINFVLQLKQVLRTNSELNYATDIVIVKVALTLN